VFCVYLRTNCDLCHLQHKLIGFYNRAEKCLQRGTDWVFKYSGLRFVFKGLNDSIFTNPASLFSTLRIFCSLKFLGTVLLAPCLIRTHTHTHTHTYLYIYIHTKWSPCTNASSMLKNLWRSCLFKNNAGHSIFPVNRLLKPFDLARSWVFLPLQRNVTDAKRICVEVTLWFNLQTGISLLIKFNFLLISKPQNPGMFLWHASGLSVYFTPYLC